MFDKFGNLGSAEEINRTAEGFFNEGDLESLKEFAEENGIEKDMVDMYIEGVIPILTDVTGAAVGKLLVEEKGKEVEAFARKIPAEPITSYLKAHCDSEKLARAIRKKEKSLLGCLEHIEKEAKNKVTKEKPYLSDETVFRMAKNYYLKWKEV